MFVSFAGSPLTTTAVPSTDCPRPSTGESIRQIIKKRIRGGPIGQAQARDHSAEKGEKGWFVRRRQGHILQGAEFGSRRQSVKIRRSSQNLIRAEKLFSSFSCLGIRPSVTFVLFRSGFSHVRNSCLRGLPFHLRIRPSSKLRIMGGPARRIRQHQQRSCCVRKKLVFQKRGFNLRLLFKERARLVATAAGTPIMGSRNGHGRWTREATHSNRGEVSRNTHSVQTLL